MKKIISLLLVVIVALSFCMNALAYNPSDDTISIEEFEEILKQAYAEYGIDFKVIAYDSNSVITQEILQQELAKVANNCNIYVIESESPNSIYGIGIADSVQSMIETKDKSKSIYVSGYEGYAYIKVLVNATIDHQNSYITSVNSVSAYQSGFCVNFSGWTLQSATSTRNSPSNGYVSVRVRGQAVFTYTIPEVNVQTQYTADVDKTVQLDFRGYGS